MRRYCTHCDTRYNDAFREPTCPHDAVKRLQRDANKAGVGGFCPHDGQRLQASGSLLTCPGCGYYVRDSDL